MVRNNIVVFGEAGSGKSSTINMIVGQDVARTDDSGRGCTLYHSAYQVNIGGTDFVLYDTAGLDDSERVPSVNAIVQLYALMKGLAHGICLLVFVMNPRIRATTKKNWTLFRDILCKNRVPAVLLVTHLEHLNNMDDWWVRNLPNFRQYGILPIDHACITAIKGRVLPNGQHTLQAEYNESRERARSVIQANYLHTPWRTETMTWYKEVVHETIVVRRWFLWTSTQKIAVLQGKGFADILKEHGISEEEANKLTEELAKV